MTQLRPIETHHITHFASFSLEARSGHAVPLSYVCAAVIVRRHDKDVSSQFASGEKEENRYRDTEGDEREELFSEAVIL